MPSYGIVRTMIVQIPIQASMSVQKKYPAATGSWTKQYIIKGGHS
ncbi:hypothetical protein JOC76_002074 [Neobacillus cucumis]|nr:hypothetical protein [Neobacillus cucumis]